ncbi:MAG: helix-turn-helix domain-containing protein [Myxococcota bacterium]|jgi:excisionase family DNA binding protein|nr:helix-turn-helix domain-containing protein [Myxococcota bacterium]
MTELYSVDQLAELLDLHPKTVRRFIREGRIKARKIGREWRVHRDDLRDFTHAELAGGQPEPVSETPLGDRVRVSAVIEVAESGAGEVTRLSNTLIALLNGKDPAWGPARYDLIFHPETRRARFVLYGSSAFLRTVLELVETLLLEPGASTAS